MDIFKVFESEIRLRLKAKKAGGFTIATNRREPPYLTVMLDGRHARFEILEGNWLVCIGHRTFNLDPYTFDFDKLFDKIITYLIDNEFKPGPDMPAFSRFVY